MDQLQARNSHRSAIEPNPYMDYKEAEDSQQPEGDCPRVGKALATVVASSAPIPSLMRFGRALLVLLLSSLLFRFLGSQSALAVSTIAVKDSVPAAVSRATLTTVSATLAPAAGDVAVAQQSSLQAWAISVWPAVRSVLVVVKEQGLLLSVLLALSAFFSMAETSITTLWPWKVRELAEKESEGSVFHLLRSDVTRFLTTILIGTTIVNIWATALVTEAATTLFGEAGVSAATGVMTVLLLLLTEITPKSIAVHNATEVVRVVLRPVAMLSTVLYPVGRVCTACSSALLRLFGMKSSGEPFVSEEELKLMLRGAEMSGAIEEEEQDMIENVLDIKDTYVREVMTPLVDVVAVDAAATLLEFRQLWVTHQYSRVPVFEKRVDNIVGIAYAMDMLDYVEQADLLQSLKVGRMAHRPAYFVPDSMSVWNLLREFRIRKVHMAIVLNEYGGTVGLVTLEDVVEEIVGEIFDENDSKEEIRKKTGYVIRRAEGVFDVDANTTVEDLAEALGVKIPVSPSYYETVSGLVCEVFGYIPRTGDKKVIRFHREDEDDDERRREEEDEGEDDEDEDRRQRGQPQKQKQKQQQGQGQQQQGSGETQIQSEQRGGGRVDYLRFRVEILAGNARKVGAVRFELLDGDSSSSWSTGAFDNGSSAAAAAEREREKRVEEKEVERQRERERERALTEEWKREREREERRKEEILGRMVRGRGMEEEEEEEEDGEYEVVVWDPNISDCEMVAEGQLVCRPKEKRGSSNGNGMRREEASADCMMLEDEVGLERGKAGTQKAARSFFEDVEERDKSQAGMRRRELQVEEFVGPDGDERGVEGRGRGTSDDVRVEGPWRTLEASSSSCSASPDLSIEADVPQVGEECQSEVHPAGDGLVQQAESDEATGSSGVIEQEEDKEEEGHRGGGASDGSELDEEGMDPWEEKEKQVARRLQRKRKEQLDTFSGFQRQQQGQQGQKK